jgi:hypothetical protein
MERWTVPKKRLSRKGWKRKSHTEIFIWLFCPPAGHVEQGLEEGHNL